MRLVLDSNIFISSLITVGTPPDLLCRQWRARNFDLITSREQIAEIMRVAGYAKLQKYFTQEQAADLLKDLHYEECGRDLKGGACHFSRQGRQPHHRNGTGRGR